MTHNANAWENLTLPLPITQMARRTAEQFASQQPTPQKAEQVRLNTLAVWAVNDYLQTIGIPTDLSQSDSWNPIVRLCADVADLAVTGIGRLECRPLKASASSCYVPPEVWSDRIAYVAVQIDESSLEATVLGFAQTAQQEELPLHQLQPIDDLIDHLHPSVPVAATGTTPRIQLSQWLASAFETGWQAVEELLAPTQPDLAFSFRSAESALLERELPEAGVRRAKLINLGVELAGYPVVLVVELIPETEQRRNILLQVHPSGDRVYLPPHLQLTVLDEAGLIFLEAEARSADNYIQLQFRGLPGEQFSVRVALGDTSVAEDFVI
jgi:hypothetical protein